MNKTFTIAFCLSLTAFIISCDGFNSETKNNTSDTIAGTDIARKNLLRDFIAVYEDGEVNAAIEIPSGTMEKWEINKTTGLIEWELVNDIPRIVNYLGYPGNYGFIPRTLLSKEQGGDGDPLDIIVLGPPKERGEVVKCKIIGVLFLTDRGEQDDKLVAVSKDSPLYQVNKMSELNDNYSGIPEILQLWFVNYKGPGIMESKGFGDKDRAMDIIKAAMMEFEKSATTNNRN
jgi:inorganic pyrophosphatase